MIAAGIGVMLGGCVLASVLVWRQAHQGLGPDAEPEGDTAAAAIVPSVAVPIAEPTITPPPGPAVVAPPVVVAQEPVVDAGPAAPTASARGPRVGAGTRAGAGRPPPPPDCTTPYWFDAQNVKHYKTAVLRQMK